MPENQVSITESRFKALLEIEAEWKEMKKQRSFKVELSDAYKIKGTDILMMKGDNDNRIPPCRNYEQ